MGCLYVWRSGVHMYGIHMSEGLVFICPVFICQVVRCSYVGLSGFHMSGIHMSDSVVFICPELICWAVRCSYVRRCGVHISGGGVFICMAYRIFKKCVDWNLGSSHQVVTDAVGEFSRK